ncbi:uncharacterized protein YecE (DUF72 family) [Mucilaginibacter sp. SG538B]|nr:hypothetical protein [Mucilaginibacter sp. SG538B]NVM66551.1 uncharacterized protein YecE (DUF72 family) [Mucilaginibacter sp. SG538B]
MAGRGLQRFTTAGCGLLRDKPPGIAGRSDGDRPVAYYRFHGAPDLYRSFYSDEALAGLKQISNQHSFVNIIYKLQCLK